MSAAIATAKTKAAEAAPVNGACETTKVGRRDPVAPVTISRPKNLNAFNVQLSLGVFAAVALFDGDYGIGFIVITCDVRASVVGADVEEIDDKVFVKLDRNATTSKPIVAVVVVMRAAADANCRSRAILLLQQMMHSSVTSEPKRGIDPASAVRNARCMPSASRLRWI